jgi:hypothetical protein
MSVITRTDPGAIPTKNLKIIGQTTKYANAAPALNKITVDSINGPTNNFSFLNKPGAINDHSS